MSQKQRIYKTRKLYQAAGAIFFSLLFLVIFVIGFAISLEPTEVKRSPEDLEATFTVIEGKPQSAGPITAQAAAEPTKAYYDVPLDHDTQDYIFEVSEQYGVPSAVIVAIIERESGYDADATGSAGEQGYMQIHPCNNSWLKQEIGITDFYDPEQNILCGVYMLSGLFEKYGTVNEVLMAYNCGEAGARRLWNNGITETEYCTKIQTIISGLKISEAG